MSYDNVPIANFVAQKFQTPAVQKIVDGWRIEGTRVIDKVIEHFREMGVFQVPFQHERLITESMLFHLKTSPDIARMVYKARNDEMRRQRNRHSE